MNFCEVFISLKFQNLKPPIGGNVAQAVSRSPPTARVPSRVSVTPCGFPGGRNGVLVGFLGVSPIFPYYKFYSTVSPHPCH